MNKYAKMKEVANRETEFRNEQAALHEKHKDIDQNKVIVEKSMAVKHTYSFIKSICRTIVGVLFILLVAIGVITLIYPELRTELISILSTIYNEISSMI